MQLPSRLLKYGRITAMKDLIISGKKAPSSTETGDLTVTGDSIGAGKTASEPHWKLYFCV